MAASQPSEPSMPVLPSTSPLRALTLACLGALVLVACQPASAPEAARPAADTAPPPGPSYAEAHADDYAVVPLEADLSGFDTRGKRMIAKLVEASRVMDDLWWQQSWSGGRDALLARAPDEATRELVRINFGPWDRLNEDTPFIEGIEPRPPGGTFYPVDMSKAAF